MHYEIRRGFNGKNLSKAQRTSGTFAEEPVVFGKVLRRGSKPLILNELQFEANRAKLLRLVLNGSIEVFSVDGATRKSIRLDYKAAPEVFKKEETAPPAAVPPAPAAATSAGDGGLPPATEEGEEQEASEPPSSEGMENDVA
jgi:ribosomal protein L12E/L44/L45/RPP1/RPP2